MKFAWLSALFGKDITSDSKITKEEIEAAETKGQQLQDENNRLTLELSQSRKDAEGKDDQIAQLTAQMTQSRQDAEAQGGQIIALTAELETLRTWKSNHTEGRNGAAEARDASDADKGKKGFVADASYNLAAIELHEKLHGKKAE